MIDVVCTWEPPNCAKMLPHAFVLAAALTTPPPGPDGPPPEADVAHPDNPTTTAAAAPAATSIERADMPHPVRFGFVISLALRPLNR